MALGVAEVKVVLHRQYPALASAVWRQPGGGPAAVLMGLEGLALAGGWSGTYTMPKNGANRAMRRPLENCILSDLGLEKRDWFSKNYGVWNRVLERIALRCSDKRLVTEVVLMINT